MENKGLNYCFKKVDIYPKERLNDSCRNWNIDGKCVKMEEVQTIREEEKLVNSDRTEQTSHFCFPYCLASHQAHSDLIRVC